MNMRSLIFPLLLLAAPAAAQQPAPDRIGQQRDAMRLLDWMDGTWRGDAVMQGPAGEMKIVQMERVGSMLGGTIKLVEGKGFRDGRAGFNALGVISYDPDRRSYALRSYAQGYEGTFPLVVSADGWSWEMPAPGGAVIRYTTRLKDGAWHEIGERITPGGKPVPIFEMTLRRAGATDWPGAGGLGAE